MGPIPPGNGGISKNVTSAVDASRRGVSVAHLAASLARGIARLGGGDPLPHTHGWSLQRIVDGAEGHSDRWSRDKNY